MKQEKEENPANETISLSALNDFLFQHQINDSITEVKKFSGGYSNLTYLLASPTQKYVLRCPPAGAKHIKGGHDMVREYQLLNTLQKADFREAPNTMVLGTENDFLGVPFYIMEYVDGTILRAADVPQLLQQANEKLMQERSENLCDKLVALHAIDIESTQLIQLGKPNGYIKRQVEGWFARYEKAKTDEIAEMIQVGKWLIAHIPTENKPTLLHNDFKFDNVVFSTENPAKISKILDWEMATVGDPLMDVGPTLAYWAEAGDEDFSKAFNISWLKGNLTRNEFVERYAQKSGRDLSNILFYYVFGLFKNAVIIQQIYSRYKAGLTADPRFKNLIVGVSILSKKALHSIQLGEMK